MVGALKDLIIGLSIDDYLQMFKEFKEVQKFLDRTLFKELKDFPCTDQARTFFYHQRGLKTKIKFTIYGNKT